MNTKKNARWQAGDEGNCSPDHTSQEGGIAELAPPYARLPAKGCKSCNVKLRPGVYAPSELCPRCDGYVTLYLAMGALRAACKGDSRE